MNKRHSIKVRWLAFRIWQELGDFPWKKAPVAPAPAAAHGTSSPADAAAPAASTPDSAAAAPVAPSASASAAAPVAPTSRSGKSRRSRSPRADRTPRKASGEAYLEIPVCYEKGGVWTIDMAAASPDDYQEYLYGLFNR